MQYFITESNFKKAFKEVEATIEDIKYIENILKEDLIKLFGRNEIKAISSAKAALECMQDIDTLTLRIKKVTPVKKEKADPKTRFIYLQGSPAYHTSKTCPRLHSEYKNYEIPVTIKEKDIVEYRKFFLENIDLYNSRRDIFFARVELKFNIKIAAIKEIEKPNSGAELFSEFDLDTEEEEILLRNIFQLGNDMVQFKFSSEERRKAIQKYGLASHKVVRKDDTIPINDEDFKIIEIWYNYKITLKDYVTRYLILKFNPDLAFDQACLESLGFKACAECSKQDNSEIEI